MAPREGRPRILFVCTGNACRSQIAEGILHLLAGDAYESLSAGSHAAGFVHPLAVAALEEVGAARPAARSQSIDEFLPPRGEPPGLVITLCDFARRHVATRIRGLPHLHWPHPDPIEARGSDEERLNAFRWTRDRICLRLEDALEGGELEDAIGES